MISVKELLKIIDISTDVRIIFIDWGLNNGTTIVDTYSDKMTTDDMAKIKSFSSAKIFRVKVEEKTITIFFTEW